MKHSRLFGGIVLTVLALLTCVEASAITVTSCEGAQRADTLAATAFIDANLSDMVAGMTFLSNAQQAEVLRKWSRLRLRCRERNWCRKSEFGGHAHGGPGNAVKLCYDNLVDIGGLNLCDLVMVIVHEMGHAHGFRTFADHNNPSANTLANDLVYQMGNAALAFCNAAATADTFDNVPLSGTRRVALGESCGRNPDCASGTCQGTGQNRRCVCDEDPDCDGTETCIRRPARANVCAPTGLPTGAACFRDRQCTSGRCRDGRRTCR